MPSECVLVTGGAGFIGSHSTIEVVTAGYDAVIVDNLVNANIGESISLDSPNVLVIILYL